MIDRIIKKVLLIEDNPGDARLLREMVREHGAQVRLTHAESMGDAEIALSGDAVDVILLDLGLPDADGLEALRRAGRVAPRTPLVVLTGTDDESVAVAALHEGAQDYLVKGQIDARGLFRALRYAVERKYLEEALYVEKERAQVTLNSIGDAVICTNSAGTITFLNSVAERLTGWRWHEASGQPMADVFRMKDGTCLSTAAELEVNSDVQSSTNCILIRRDGFEIPIEDSIAPIRDRNGQTTGAVVVFHDVSISRAMTEQMAHTAQHDYLTGLPNRLFLNDRVNQAIALARRHNTQVAVLYLDLDGFKHINDSLGHSCGDKLLRSVAKRLVGCARATDTVSRQGGDEFVVLLSEVIHPEDAAIAARRMLAAVAAPHTVENHELHMTTSIGISVFPDDGHDAEILIKNADTAMYQAKETGRHSYQYFKPAMNARAVERQAIEEGLRRAIERDELELHYQPKVNFRTGAITGAEALLRWNHPSLGPVTPAQFIPIAEDTGLIVPIGHWVLRHACEQARAWVDAGLNPGSMAVNVSAIEFQDDEFLRGLFGILRETQLDPTTLELELTESVLMKQTETAARILQTVRDCGIQVALDDFGTGFSSLSYLRQFPIDVLKIDRSFVGEVTTTPDDASLVTAVINMARSLRLRVVAEGVETREQLQFLRQQDCDEAQGFYFSRPITAHDFASLLGTNAPTAAAAA